MRNLFILSIILWLSLAGCDTGTDNSPAANSGRSSGTPAAAGVSCQNWQQRLRDAVADPQRREQNRQRDQYRHPQQVLSFFTLKPEQVVVEIWPSGGWWTEILAPYLRDCGTYVAAGFALDARRTPAWRKTLQRQYNDWLAEHPERFDQVQVTGLSVPERTQIAAPGSADRVLTFRNVHNWMNGGYAEEMFTVIYLALKPAGILGLVEHRAAPGTPLEQMLESGYVTEAHVIELAERAGFRLLDQSAINANPADSKDYPAGVWSLPPGLRLGDQNRDQYLAIGESDRMTLKFIK